MRKIKISFRSQMAEATLLEKEAPKACNAIWNRLPIEADVHCAKVAGEEVFFMVPFVLNPERGGELLEAGSIAYFPPAQSICIYYWSRAVRARQATVFAKITENLEGIVEEFKKVRYKQGDKILIQRACVQRSS